MSSEHLAEVWGDVVDLRHLRLAVIIGAVVSLGAYYGAVETFRVFGDGAAVDRAYAMLVGLAGCILSCVVCARLFPPKRILLEAGEDPSNREAAIAALFEGGADRDAALPDAARDEIRALGLIELLSEPAAQKPDPHGASPLRPIKEHV